ncbi:MAG: biotin--[acetyl-CoA-carboxylase] ligase [Prochlorotrichaceae cyanobacterium]|jgi:BirA family biotin operon repressor/biotin-[acetyl-CoA-carboxylase] ligase
MKPNPDTFQQDFYRYGEGVNEQLELILLAETDSTNRVAWDAVSTALASASPTREILVIAEHQTAGRGQWGRSWQSEPGGLYLSLGILLRPDQAIPNDRFSLIPLFAALEVAQGLQQYQIPVSLKWPNDLCLVRQKLGGLLVETRHSRLNPAIVIGIGLNWQNQPPAPGIALHPYQQDHKLTQIASLPQLAAIVFKGLKQGYAAWCNPHTNLADFIHRYESQLAYRGRWIPIGSKFGGTQLGESELGQILGITATGALRVAVNGVEQGFMPGSLQLGWGE